MSMPVLRYALGVVLLGGLCGAAADPLSDALGRMDRASAGFHGLTANIKKVSHTAILNEDATDSGTFAIKRNGPKDLRMLLDIKEPDAKQIAFSGTRAEIYYPKMNSEDIWDLGKNRSLVDQFLLLGFGSNSRDLVSAYNIKLGGEESLAGEKATRIELVPKSPEALQHIKRVDLWIAQSSGLTVQQKFYQPGGDYTLTLYTNLKLVPNLPDSAVQLKAPKNVKKQYPQK
jgi:outer membrane lipoprotein-sorting protein